MMSNHDLVDLANCVRRGTDSRLVIFRLDKVLQVYKPKRQHVRRISRIRSVSSKGESQGALLACSG